MSRRAAPAGVVVVLLALAGAGRAAAADVAAVTLPSRFPGAAALAARIRPLGQTFADRLGARLVDGPGSETSAADVSTLLARAEELAAAGQLDEAARLLDDALEAGGRAPHRFADSDALVAAHVTRAGIALARGEGALATRLLGRLLRWDPTFVLRAAEDTPRLREALAEARGQLGDRPALGPAELGGLCGLDELLVVRPLGPGRLEVLRLRRCRVVATALVSGLDDGVLAVLGAPPAPPPPPPAPRLWQRGWFWVGVGAVTATAAVIVWTVATPGDEELDVVPRY